MTLRKAQRHLDLADLRLDPIELLQDVRTPGRGGYPQRLLLDGAEISVPAIYPAAHLPVVHGGREAHQRQHQRERGERGASRPVDTGHESVPALTGPVVFGNLPSFPPTVLGISVAIWHTVRALPLR